MIIYILSSLFQFHSPAVKVDWSLGLGSVQLVTLYARDRVALPLRVRVFLLHIVVVPFRGLLLPSKRERRSRQLEQALVIHESIIEQSLQDSQDSIKTPLHAVGAGLHVPRSVINKRQHDTVTVGRWGTLHASATNR